MDRMKSVGLHIVWEATGTTDATNHNEFLPRDTQLRKCFLYGIQDGIVTASRTPANLIGRYKIFFSQRLGGFEGFRAHIIFLK